ncbi:hypothetical protein ED733_004816 [Metarhizium rileyi]|uniref:Uncharacterized protein n=1 Tax=Metarhizium rileyi (strain RCEF 4871) TaxID=1649241 RepID=A0A5C6GHZ3_METRR|nr:hypothetical protein ED733_004816 [Metarhizium rileyi]
MQRCLSVQIGLSLPDPMSTSVARDREWFQDDYTPFPSHLYCAGKRLSDAVGVGTVCLPVKTSCTSTGPSSHGILRLSNVLHMPDAVVNIIGNLISDDFYLDVCAPTAKVAARLLDRQRGKTAALLTPGSGPMCDMQLVKLSGHPVGPRVGPHLLTLQPGFNFLCINWPLAEQERYFRCKYWKEEVSVSAPRARSTAKERSTADGIGWVQKTLLQHRERQQISSLYFPPTELDYVDNDWGDTASFMKCLCLNPYVEEHCVKAKNIASNFAALYHQEDKDWEGCEDDRKPHNVDKIFTERQLYYINRDHGNSSLFMSDKGFDANNDEHRAEARDMAEEFYLDSDDEEEEEDDYGLDDHDIDEYGLYEEDGMDEYKFGALSYEFQSSEGLAERRRDHVLAHLSIGTYVTGPRQLAEHFLSEEEVSFVNQTYGNAMSFMTCFNLKFYRAEDCLAAKAVAASMMPDEVMDEIDN